MMTLGCGEASLDCEPSAQTMASPEKMPRRPSSQVTSDPCRVQACAIAGLAAAPANVAIRTDSRSVRVIIMPVSNDCGANIVVDRGRIPVQGLTERRYRVSDRSKLPSKFNELGKL